MKYLRKEGTDHGDWLPWLKDNFGWTDQTARNYMRVAESFKSQTGLNLDVNIDAKALYLLSANGVLKTQ